jgi:hypothetical protein
MTTGQQESLHLIYVNVCNAYIYASDLCDDDSYSPLAKRDTRVIRDKLRWIKNAIELRTDSKMLQSIDTLMYDELFRLLSELDVNHQEALEKLIFDYVTNIK